MFTEKDIDKELLAFQYLLKDTRDRLRRHDYAGLDPVIADLAKDWGVTVPASNSEIYKELCRGLLRTDARIFETELKRTDGDYSGDVLFSMPLAPVGLQSAKSYRLSEVIKFFVEEYTKAEAWTDRTVTDNNAIFRDLLEIVGDGIIGSLTRDSLLEFRRLVQKLPPRRTNDPRYRDLSIREIDQLDDVECIEPRTANKYFTRVSQFFNWAKEKGYVKENLAESLHVKEKKKSKVSRDDFDKEDLRLIFFNDIFKSVRNGTNYRRLYMHWLPLIALFTGSRIEEIATLKTKDLYQVEGVWVFDINTDPDINPDGTPLFVPEKPKDALEASKSTKKSKTKEKSVKTEASVRKIAIHPTLIELGILEFLDYRKSRGEFILFPDLNPRKAGLKRGPTASNWFGRYLDQIGLPSRSDVFHSFRHTFINYLKQQGEQLVIAEELAGHEGQTVNFHIYGKPLWPSTQLRILTEKLNYYDIDFSPLKNMWKNLVVHWEEKERVPGSKKT